MSERNPPSTKPNRHDDEVRARRLARLVARWPAIDQARWNAACVPDDPFDDATYGATLRLASKLKIAKGYTQWLQYLHGAGLLDHAAPPEARISNARSAGYFRALKARGNAPFTIIGRFAELSMATRILAPDADRSCLLRPYGASIRRRLTVTKRALFVPDARLLYREALRLMDAVDLTLLETDRTLQLQFRDGLLLGLLAARGRRLGTVAQTMTGENIRFANGRFRIVYRPDQIKTHRADDVLLPDRLTPYMRIYLDQVRRRLLRGPDHGAFWVGAQGRPLGEAAIEKIVRTRTRALFGIAIGPHRARHAIGSTAPLVNRAEPGLARAVLDISEQVAAEHYNRANATIATEIFHEAMLQATRDAENHQRLRSIKKK